MKFKISIIRKLFFITAFVFAVFIGSTLLVQSLFFEKFYIYKKENDLKRDLEKLKTAYLDVSAIENLDEFVYENLEITKFKVAITDRNGKIKYMSKPVRSRFDMNNTKILTDYLSKRLEKSEILSGIIKSDCAVTSVLRFDPDREMFLIGVVPVKEKNELIFALTSLQPVNEATSIIGQFYIYFSVGALIIVILLAFIYSNLITKPLVKINKSATKMAHLDFSEKCEVKSQDEIGNVAASLNFLSERLDRALTSLKDANMKLEEDIKKERKLEIMRKEFIASVSHELKTPISLIGGYASGLKDEIFEGKDKEYYLDIILDESKKMGHLVSDMLDLSQLESGNFRLVKEEFALKDLIYFTLKKYGAIIAEKPAALETKLIDDIIVFADWNRLEQVITNFVSNALRYVDRNGTISVRMIDTGGSVCVEVENTGCHIPDDELEKIWHKFYKVDKSGNRKFGGTGLGLSIVKNILVLHNYSFGAANTENGVKFYFAVPR